MSKNSSNKEKLEKALEQLIKNDSELLLKDANERSICHKLAMYLENEYEKSDWDVDVEYNRDIEDTKSVSKEKFINALKNYYEKDELDRSKDIAELLKLEIEEGSTRRVLPDIIVHKRGKQVNEVVIELKKSTNTSDWSKDKAKLKVYRDELYYKNVYFVEINADSDFIADEIEANYNIKQV